MDKAKKISVSFYEREKGLVEKFAKSRGLDFSSALRYIINEWSESKPNPEQSH